MPHGKLSANGEVSVVRSADAGIVKRGGKGGARLARQSSVSSFPASRLGPDRGACYRADMSRALSIVTAGLLLSACSDMCANSVVSRASSPDGQHDAVLFQRDCGATTGFSTQVSILGAGDQPSGSGNAFRADDDHGSARAGDWGGSWAELRWLAPDHLLVRYAAKSRIFEQDDVVSGVKITYEPVGS